jgi:acyl-CoA hydrolase
LDYAVRWDAPLYEVERRMPSDEQMQIGRHVAGLVEDGATLQLGIGAIPDAVLQALTDRHDLGVHSEMFSDGVLDLVERGVITGARKPIDRGKIVASFVVGSRRLLDFIDDNPMVELHPSDYTNDTRIIRQFEQMVAINSAIQVDLTGQVCAESIGTHTCIAALVGRWISCGARHWQRVDGPSLRCQPLRACLMSAASKPRASF